MKITSISAWQVFDSRGKPTVSAALVAKLKGKLPWRPRCRLSPVLTPLWMK
ncbi:MAG TPA: hypothetical protein VN873_20535 [Candidatus Angelobacter sp.]|nr:hypothetical protein [Candidatus Angelobacter sp.]